MRCTDDPGVTLAPRPSINPNSLKSTSIRADSSDNHESKRRSIHVADGPITGSQAIST